MTEIVDVDGEKRAKMDVKTVNQKGVEVLSGYAEGKI